VAAERLSVRDIKELFRLRLEKQLSQRIVSKAVGCGRTTVRDYERRARQAGLSYQEILSLGHDELLIKLGLGPAPVRTKAFSNKTQRVLPDWAEIHKEMAKKNVTLALLWEEYKEKNPDGYQYTQFSVHYRRWRKTLTVSMRQDHKAGEKAFVDYAGTTAEIVDRDTGEVRTAQIFVGVMGASSYTYVEATWGQGLSDWLMSHRRMFEYFGGVPQIIVPDNLKSGVTKPNRYEATVNRSYQDLAEHYGTCVIPARVRKPQDKAKAEAGVLVASRWILAALRNKVFYSLEDLNAAIKKLLEKLNEKKMRHFEKSRRELFEEIDAPSLGRLRSQAYEYAEWKSARVNIDHHIVYQKHFYSVPYGLIQKGVEIRATEKVVEVFYKSERVASHKRSAVKGRYTTELSHRPPEHQAHLAWSPERIVKWATSKGGSVGEFVEILIRSRRHPEQAYRAALGLIRLGDKYGAERLNRACARALEVGSAKYKTVQNILKNNMDQMPEKGESSGQLDFLTTNANVRGKEYYH